MSCDRCDSFVSKSLLSFGTIDVGVTFAFVSQIRACTGLHALHGSEFFLCEASSL